MGTSEALPCEQPLDTSQSILGLGEALIKCLAISQCEEKPNCSRKGIRFIFRNLVAEPF